MADTKVGQVVHFYDKISVAIVKLEAELKVGDKVKFKHGDQEFDQSIRSMEVDHHAIESAQKGDEVGIKVDQKAKPGTEVYSVN